MRLLHTSDWHLGQEFHEHPRDHEHEAFLGWLADALEEHRIDALIVAGDIYDSQNPPIAAQKQLYRFIAGIRGRMPKLDIVLVGGNHDSAGRLEAPGPLLEPLGVRVVGSLARAAESLPNLEEVHPEEVFERCWRETYQGDPPAEMLGAFRELLEGLENGEVAA